MVIYVDGRIDSTNHFEFFTTADSVAKSRSGAVVLEFQGVHFVTSMGLRALMLLAKTYGPAPRSFALCNVSPSVREVIRFAGYEKFLNIHDAIEQALKPDQD